MSAANSSLSSTSSPPPQSRPHRPPPSDPSIIHPKTKTEHRLPNKDNNAINSPQLQTLPLTIKVSDSRGGSVPGILHLPANYTKTSSKTAAILLSGAGGGLVGPSSIYLSLGAKLPRPRPNGIPVLRLDYRYPARNKYCVADVLAAISYLEREYAIAKFVLIGWSFGGAPVFTVAGMDERRVVGCATVASQTAETEGIERLAPRPVLLLHGLADQTLGSWCSESLYRKYGGGGSRELKLFEGDDHALTRNAKVAEEMLCRFVMRCAGVEEGDGQSEVVGEEVVEGRERVELMEKAGDLRGEERVE
ncbi:MAG: hypothetical protein Q9178_004719 [Gyalolechia marmorata]